MNKLFLLLAVIMLTSCSTPTDPKPVVPVVPVVQTTTVRIYNSAWEIVQEGNISLSRNVTTIQSYADYVTEYNEAHTDDQFFLIEGDDIIPIEEAPSADAYIVDATTHDIIRQYLNWPRADLADRREVWRMQTYADAGVLYVDQIPPPPITFIDDRPAYEKYALYLIYTIDDTIKYEEHMETEAEFIARRVDYETQAYADGGLTYVVSGRLYP